MSADPTTNEWRTAKAAEIAERALVEAVDLVAISSPSGDAEAAERAVAAATTMLPAAAEVERIEICSPGCEEPVRDASCWSATWTRSSLTSAIARR